MASIFRATCKPLIGRPNAWALSPSIGVVNRFQASTISRSTSSAAKLRLAGPQNLYTKFLGFLIKKGNKVGAKRLLDEAFLIVSKKTKISTQMSLVKLFSSLNSFVEVKKVRVRRRFVMVPFSINLKRRSYLIVKWLMLAVEEDKRRVSFSIKLADEVLKVLKGVFSKSKALKNSNMALAMANRSNIHFRW
jgi:ribosomal protein S7